MDFRPLIAVDKEVMVEAITQVNNQYGGRMDYATHQKYLKDLKQAVSSSVVKLQEDKVVERKQQPKLAPNPYKVGDLLLSEEFKYVKDFDGKYSDTRVSRVTDAYVWLERLVLKEHRIWSNTETAKKYFNNVKAYGETQQGWCHGHFIPFEGNEEHLEWTPVTKRYRWDKVGMYSEDFNRKNDAQVGYCYSYEARD